MIGIKVLFVLLLAATIVCAGEVEEGRIKKHKLWPKLLVPIVHGIVIVIVVFKILLVAGFVGFLSILFHALGGIKYLLARNQPIYISEPHHEHFSGYHSDDNDFGNVPEYNIGRGDHLEGGRELANNDAYQKQIVANVHDPNSRLSEEHSRQKRSDDSPKANCKKKAICQLHARARLNPLFTFQLYFLRKEGIAQYWDHKDRSFNECGRVYPCYKQ